MLFKSHARLFHDIPPATLACMTGSVATAPEKAPASPASEKFAWISDSQPLRIDARTLSANNRSRIETNVHTYLRIKTHDHGKVETPSKLSLDGKPYLFPLYEEATHTVNKESQASRTSASLLDEDAKLALEILDNRLGFPLNNDTKSITLHNLDQAPLLNGLLQVASFNEKGVSTRPLVKRSHLTAYPTLA